MAESGWVAVKDGRVVAEGASPGEVVRAVKSKGESARGAIVRTVPRA